MPGGVGGARSGFLTAPIPIYVTLLSPLSCGGVDGNYAAESGRSQHTNYPGRA